MNEARIGSLLSHQNVVQIQDFDCEKGVYYLVMEYVEGTTVRRSIDLCRHHGRSVPISVIAEIGRQVCDGLTYAHSLADADGRALMLVHRDIKPSNLIAGPQGVVKILDFGISKALISHEQAGAVRGTWGYMAPEQADGQEVRGGADLFGLAVCLYEMATLGPLFPEKDPATVRGLMAQDEAARRASKLGGAHSALANILVRALQRDPAARFPSARAMGTALSALGQDPVTAREHLLHFHQTLDMLVSQGSAPSRKPVNEPVRAKVPEDGAGLGIAVGNRKRVHSPDEQPPVRRVVRRKKKRLTAEARRILVIPALILLALVAWGISSFMKGDADQPKGENPGVESVSNTNHGTVGPVSSSQDPSTYHGAPASNRSPEENALGAATSSDTVDAAGSIEPDSSNGVATRADTTTGISGGGGPSDGETAVAQPAQGMMSDADMSAKAGPMAPEPRSSTAPKADNFGQLTVAAPKGYLISIDGVLQRATYVGRKPVAPGSHTVTVDDGLGGRFSTEVQLEKNQTIRLQWNPEEMKFESK